MRLQPKLGAIEVRVFDAQTRAEDNAALAALVQSIVRLEATEGHVPAEIAAHPEVLDENRFLATRDGMRADFIDPEGDRRRPAREILDDLLAACGPHATELGCEAALAAVAALADDPATSANGCSPASTPATRPTPSSACLSAHSRRLRSRPRRAGGARTRAISTRPERGQDH